jgi:hypothetical protein
MYDIPSILGSPLSSPLPFFPYTFPFLPAPLSEFATFSLGRQSAATLRFHDPHETNELTTFLYKENGWYTMVKAVAETLGTRGNDAQHT